MSAYETGIHSETEAGAIDVGLFADDEGLGVAIDAPVIGRLRAAFDVLEDGSTKLTSLSREGVPVLGLTDHARVAELEAQLERSGAAVATAQARIAELEATLAEHDAEAERRLEQAQAALGATQASLDATDARQHQAHGELELTKKALAETEARLRRAQTELTASKLSFTETDLKLRTAQAETSAAKKQADEAQSRWSQTQAELSASRKALGEAEARLRRLQTQAELNKEEYEARTGATSAELADVTARLAQADELRATQDALLEQSRAELARTLEEKEAEAKRANANEVERAEALRKLQLSEDSHRADLERLGAELADVRTAHAEASAADEARMQREIELIAEQLDAEKARSVGLEVELVDLKKTVERQSADLDEERNRRDEMVRDLAFIQTQVSDLASSKGALVDRIRKMSDREQRRQRTTSEMTDVLRTAEVVAADTKASARRFEAKAAKLEDQVRGMTQEIVDLRGRAEVAENSVRMLGEQLAKTTRERDALKVDVAFFQKQIGALQREKQAQTKPKK